MVSLLNMFCLSNCYDLYIYLSSVKNNGKHTHIMLLVLITTDTFFSKADAKQIPTIYARTAIFFFF